MDNVDSTKNGYTMSEEVVVVAKESTRFDLSDPEQASAMLAHLEEYGYAVVANVAEPEQLSNGIDQFWDFWEDAEYRGPIKRDDISTWKHWMANAANGILVGARGAKHNDFSWNTRTLPKVKTAFSIIWNNEDLIVSFDASGAFRPFAHNKDWLTNGGWWHVDQNHQRGEHRHGKVTIQGLVTYYDATAETGGLCVIPGSHKYHAEVCARAPSARMKIDYVSIPRNDPVLTSQPAILVCAKAGDLILWDSRTVHCNTPALAEVNYFADKLKQSAAALQKQNEQNIDEKMSSAGEISKMTIGPSSGPAAVDGTNTVSTATPTSTTQPEVTSATAEVNKHLSTTSESSTPTPPALIRLVSYVCMVPRAHASADILHNRKQAFLHRIPTSHYPTFEGCVNEEKATFWTTRSDILSLVGYTAEEIASIQQGKDPDGESAGFGCCVS